MKRRILGIDVGKHSLHYHDPQNSMDGEVENSPKGHRAIIRLCKKQDIEMVVLEASGGYERSIILALWEKKVPVACVEASRVRNFAKAEGIFAKTDKLDARVIAWFGQTHRLRPSELQSKTFQRLRGLNHRLLQLTNLLRQEKARQDKTNDRYLLRSIKRTIKYLNEEQSRIESKMDELWEDEANLKATLKLLQSCPGVGEKTARTVVLECPELGKLSSKEIASLAGLAPMNKESGSYHGKKSISGGRRRLRSSLYMATVTAVNFNPAIREFYLRLKEKKPGKVALVACMRKLLIYLNAMVRDDTQWNHQIIKT